MAPLSPLEPVSPGGNPDAAGGAAAQIARNGAAPGRNQETLAGESDFHPEAREFLLGPGDFHVHQSSTETERQSSDKSAQGSVFSGEHKRPARHACCVRRLTQRPCEEEGMSLLRGVTR